MFLAGLFITVPYSVSYLAFTITAKADRKPPIHAKRPFPYSSPVSNVVYSYCNPRIENSIPFPGLKKFVIPGSQDPISGLDLQIGHYIGTPNRLFCA